MKPTSLLSIVSTFSKNKKLKFILAGAQLAYVGYKLFQNRNTRK